MCIRDRVRKSVPDFEPVTMDGIGLLTEVGGTAPAVLQPTVINDGTNLLCAYQFSDADGDREGAAEINWYVSDLSLIHIYSVGSVGIVCHHNEFLYHYTEWRGEKWKRKFY